MAPDAPLLIVPDVLEGAGGAGPRGARPHAGPRRCRHRLGRQDLDQGNAARRAGGAGPHPCRRGELQQPLGRAADAGADARRHRLCRDRDRHEPSRRDRAAGRMARPHVAMVTTVAAAHLEAFESIEGIAREKAAIFEGLEPGGTAIVNADLPTTPILLRGRRARRARASCTFGEASDMYRLTGVHTGAMTARSCAPISAARRSSSRSLGRAAISR